MPGQQAQPRLRRLEQRVTSDEHQVLLFPGKTSTQPAIRSVKEVSLIATEQKRLWNLAFATYQKGATLQSIEKAFAELEKAIRDPENEAIDQSVEDGAGSSVKSIAINAHANAYSNLSYMAQDLKNKGQTQEGEALFAVLKTAKANREVPEQVMIMEQRPDDPDRAIKNLQAAGQQPQL